MIKRKTSILFIISIFLLLTISAVSADENMTSIEDAGADIVKLMRIQKHSVI